MSSPKKLKAPIEETPIIADEATHEIREQSRPSGQAMFDNACRILQRLDDERTELQSNIGEKQYRIEQLRANIREAEQACAIAEQKKDAIAGQINRQRTRVTASENTPAHGEHSSILAGLLSALEEAQTALQEAAQGKEEAEKNLSIIAELQASLEEEQDKLSNHLRQQTEMQAVKREAWDLIGRDEANLLRAEIEALKTELREHEVAIPRVKDELRRKLDSIKGRLSRWPDEATAVSFSHGSRLTLDDQSSEIEHLFHAYIEYVRALYKWKISGPRTLLQGRLSIFEALALTPQTIINLMNDTMWYGRYRRDEHGVDRYEACTQLIEVAEKWIQLEREKNRPQDISFPHVPPAWGPLPQGPI